jgi:hypothetical protein
MANFEDPLEEQVVENQLEAETEETPEVEEPTDNSQEEQVEAQSVDDSEEDLPSKYKGKSVKEIIKMHQEAEKFIGKQAQEVGEHRKFFDEMMKRELLQSRQQASKEPETDTNEEYFTDPEKSMERYISNHPAIKQAEEQAALMRAQTVTQKLQQAFPDFQEIVQDDNFKQWVNSSPVRQRLYQEADGGYDFDSAAELLGTWKAISGSAKQKQKEDIVTTSSENRAKSLKAAAVDTGTSSVGSAKVYSRAALRELLRTNPSKYYEHADEFLQAYAEGRVK